jgi:hypothetical protein
MHTYAANNSITTIHQYPTPTSTPTLTTTATDT